MSYQSPLWLNQGPVLTIHLVVETTGVAEIVSVAISPPEWGGSGSTVDALTTLCMAIYIRYNKKEEEDNKSGFTTSLALSFRRLLSGALGMLVSGWVGF